MAVGTVSVFCILIALTSLILHKTGLISIVVCIPIFLLSCFFKSYGKFLTYTDVWMDEDLNITPRSTLVVTMALQGDLSLNELINHFKNEVLEARSTGDFYKLRYPELQQFVTTFLCFRIWKNDTNFRIENHIKEISVDSSLSGETLIEHLHQINLNKPYANNRSPWELTLIRNVNLKNDDELMISLDSEQKSVLVFRVHHVMADVKSVLKLLVECLGKKPLKTALPEIIEEETTWSKFKFVVKFPINYLVEKRKFWNLIIQSYHHPWKSPFNFGKQVDPNFKMVVGFSPEIEIIDLKTVAKEHNVKTSAVVLSIIAGSIKIMCGDKWDKKVVVSYPLPKPNHPEFLTNHVYMGTLTLATDQVDGLKRLQFCNEEFVRMKVKQQAKYLNGNAVMCGIQMYPLSRFFTNMPVPIGITNNAGEEEGFFVGKAECIDFRMSTGTLHGLMGVLFCIMSYKGKMRIAVIANESVLEKETVQKLAKRIGLELQLLINGP